MKITLGRMKLFFFFVFFNGERTRLARKSVAESARLFTRRLLPSLPGVPIPRDRNITRKQNKCLSKIHKNVELYDYKLNFALYITI